MPVVVAQDDVIIRTVQVVLDPDTPAERRAAFADYFSVDVPDFDSWLAHIRAQVPGLFPATVHMVKDQDAFHAALPDADAAVIESLAMGEKQLDLAGRLKVVQNFGIDLRNIDQAACAKRGVAVKPLRRRVNIAVAEHAMALMLALAKRICLTHGRLDVASLEQVGFPARMYDRRHVAGANWSRVDGLVTLSGATLGALGLGEIGREVALRARGFDMDVLYHQRNRLPDDLEARFGARYCGFEEILERSDVVSIHLPLNTATEGMIDAAAFRRMKPGALLVNISRAAIIERDALIEALESGKLGGAGLDVHYAEPGEADDPLKRFNNTVLTPHNAVASRVNAAADMEELVGNLAEAVG
jgi:phosphoglycerate dehydrogenase-like enzyme